MKKKGLFQRGFTREETGKQLAGTYCINKKVEDTSCWYWEQFYKMVQAGNKGFDLKSNFNKMLLLTMLRMINHLRPRNRRSSQHDLPNLDWQLFAAPLSRATLDDPNFLIRLLMLTMAISPPSEKQILGSIVTSLGVISRKRTLSLPRLLYMHPAYMIRPRKTWG